MFRHSKIKMVGYCDQGNAGPDTAYVVEMFEDDTLVESRILPGKDKCYAEDLAENWETAQGEFNDRQARCINK
jgi:hypothetical protein